MIAGAMLAFGLTVLRLSGELAGWSSPWFATEAGGGGAIVGIGWLIPVLGAVFGVKLCVAGHGPSSTARALAWVAFGMALAAGAATYVVVAMDRTVTAMLAGGAGAIAGAVAAARGWPQLARANVAFALACRAPILVLTPLAVAANWGTHYEKLAPGSAELPPATRAVVLCSAQLLFWVPWTVILGGFAGVFAAAVRTRFASPAARTA